MKITLTSKELAPALEEYFEDRYKIKDIKILDNSEFSSEFSIEVDVEKNKKKNSFSVSSINTNGLIPRGDSHTLFKGDK